MAAMETLSNAIERLIDAGYTTPFEADAGQLVCSTCTTRVDPSEVDIDEMVRFEGVSDPGDEAVLYAIDAGCDHRGYFSAPYGLAASPEDVKVLRALPDRTD